MTGTDEHTNRSAKHVSGVFYFSLGVKTLVMFANTLIQKLRAGGRRE